MAQAKLL